MLLIDSGCCYRCLGMLWLEVAAFVLRFLLLRSGVSRDLSSLAELAVLSSKAEYLSWSPGPGLGRPDLEVISPPYCEMIGWSCSPVFTMGLAANYELLLWGWCSPTRGP